MGLDSEVDLLSSKVNRDGIEFRRVYRIDSNVFVVDRFPNAKQMQYYEKLAAIEHPAIVKPTSLTYDGKQTVCVFPYITGKRIGSINSATITRDMSKSICTQVVGGICALADANLVHNDIQKTNCIYNPENGLTSIIDYEFLSAPGPFAKTLKREYWQPPEWGKSCTFTTDIYLFCDMARESFYNVNTTQWFETSDVPEKFAPLLKKGLHPDMSKRPSPQKFFDEMQDIFS